MKNLIKKSIFNKFLRSIVFFINIWGKLKTTHSKKTSLKNRFKRIKAVHSIDNQNWKLETELSKGQKQYKWHQGKNFIISINERKIIDSENRTRWLGTNKFRAMLMLFIIILAYVGLNNYLIMVFHFNSNNFKSNQIIKKNNFFLPFISLLKMQKKIDNNNLKEVLYDENLTIFIDPLDLDFTKIDKKKFTKKHLFLSNSYFEEDKSKNESRDSQTKCVLAKLDPYNKELMQFIHKEPPIICNPKKNWIYVENGTIRVSRSAVEKHGVIICAYIPLYRGNNDFSVHEGNKIFPVIDKMPLISDFFKIDCRSKDGSIYSNIHSGIAYDPSLHIRHMWNPLPKTALGYNVLMFGFDSVSRMSWIRMLPKSYEYMVKEGFVILKGYNIVGDGTPQALLPILTGKKETELHEARRGFANASHVDDFPWIWKRFKNAGYVTQWAEDMQSIGTFQMRLLGFKQQPVDHYMRLFYLEAEKYYVRFKKLCLGSLSRHENMINWVKEFYSVYESKPKFSFIFHSEASHNYNNPLGLLDHDIKNFLIYLKTSGIMKNTVLLFMSDHGARVSDIRKYSQGKLEEVDIIFF